MNIRLVRGDGCLQITPCPPYLVKYLEYSHRSLETVHYQRVNKYETKLLHIPDGEGGVITLQGFFQKVCRLIEKNNDLFTVEDRRTPMPPIDWEAVRNVGMRDYQIGPTVDFLTAGTENCGVIRATGGWGKTYIMAMTYAAWNGLNTIIATPLKAIFDQTYKKFVKLFPDIHVGRCGDGFKDISDRVTISTFASLKHCALEKCQMLLVDEIHQGTGEAFQNVMSQIHPIRVFGYTATDKNLFNRSDKLLKGQFGDRLLQVDYPEAESDNAVVPCKVFFVRIPDSAMFSGSSIETKMRRGIKRCVQRNELIGSVCRLVPNKWQTIVFVEHVVDHLVPLCAHMPQGTTYIHRDSSKKSAGVYALTPKQQDQVVKDFRENKTQFLIATDCLRAGADIPNIRVVVQASGGSSEVEILQEAYRGSRTVSQEELTALGVEPKTHMVLIDFYDNHDEVLHGMALKRRALYEKQGWEVAVVDDPKDIDWTFKPKQL